jgi:hypothetical protein
MKKSAILIAIALTSSLLSPAFARVEGYGARRFTRVGHYDGHEHRGAVIDRDRGPGWGGVIAGGLLGAAAGLALGGAIAGPPVAPVYAPPPIGTVVPTLPYACPTVPTYSGGVLYDCGGIYYQPMYEGYSLTYQVVPAP